MEAWLIVLIIVIVVAVCYMLRALVLTRGTLRGATVARVANHDVQFQEDGKGSTISPEELASAAPAPARPVVLAKRPATPLQKVVLEYCGVEPPRGITVEDAERLYENARETRTDEQRAEVEAFEALIFAFEDANFRSEVGVLKPWPSRILSVVRILQVNPTTRGKALDRHIVAARLRELA